MFNSMNRMATVKAKGDPVLLAVGAIALALLTACGRSGSTPSSGRAPASAAASARQVVISGAINKTYTPVEISAVKINDRVGISLIEEFPCGAELRFPIDMKPGAYPIGELPLADVIAQYSPDCWKYGNYLSEQGTLKLTASGGKYSGEFEFTAKHNRAQSKTIKVSGSFSDAALP